MHIRQLVKIPYHKHLAEYLERIKWTPSLVTVIVVVHIKPVLKSVLFISGHDGEPLQLSCTKQGNQLLLTVINISQVKMRLETKRLLFI